MYLTDLTFIDDGHPDVTPSGLINFVKRRQMSAIIRVIQEFQVERHNFAPLPEVVQLIGTRSNPKLILLVNFFFNDICPKSTYYGSYLTLTFHSCFYL